VDLRVISLFEHLSGRRAGADPRAVLAALLRQGEEIVGDHENTTDIFFILSGTVRVTSFTDAGREVIFSDVSAGGIFGEFSAIDRLPRSASGVALSDCTLARMPSGAFFTVLRESNGVCLQLVELLVAKIRTMSERVFEVSALAVRERVRRELVRLAATIGRPDGHGVTISPAPTPLRDCRAHRLAPRGGDARGQPARAREAARGRPALDPHHRLAPAEESED
jgi:CRP-like cAMP-binding protein